MTIKVGVIGLGAIGERVLNRFFQHALTEVTAVCDVSEERLQAVKQKYDLTTYTDYKEMLLDDSISLVYLAVPPKFHHSIALDVIKAKKHFLCEKPLANSIDEANEMAQAAEAAQIVNAVNFPMVYSNVFQTFKEKILSGEIGSVKRVEVQMHFTTWPRAWQQNDWIASREQGGYIREVGPHYIQMVQDVFGDLKNIQSFVDYPEDQALCENGFVARMELENGTTVLFNGLSNIGQKEHISFKVYGDKGTVEITNWSILHTSEGDQSPITLPLQREDKFDLIEELVKAINGDESILVSFRQGYEVQRVLESMLGNA